MNQYPKIINVEGLNKRFGEKTVVSDFHLQLGQGEICGFLGANGSGKTTTLRMLCGLLTPDAGKGTCLGLDILKESFEIKKQIAYMTQSFSLYGDLTAYENLELVARIYQLPHIKKTIEMNLIQFGLMDRKNQLAGEMSGGWKQRLALAACMLHSPKLLLLDEPTAGVDPKARREFWDHIFELSSQGITTLVSTHYMDEAERCTKLVYIANGALLVSGTLSEIIGQAKLTTWRIRGDSLISLAQQLKALFPDLQVGFFGHELHVSGRDENQLNQWIAPYQNSNWEKISPNIEDIFIHYVSKKEKT